MDGNTIEKIFIGKQTIGNIRLKKATDGSFGITLFFLEA